MVVILTSDGASRYGATDERDIVFVVKTLADVAIKPPLLYAHAHKSNVGAMLGDPDHYPLFSALAEDFTVCVADLGYVSGNADLWGNSININRVAAVKTYLNGLGATGAMGIVARSHGTLASLNFAKANPTLVKFVAAITPALSLDSLSVVNGGAYGADINSRYGGNYNDVAHGATYSPHIYRAAFAALSPTVPTAFWTVSDDDITLNAYVNDWVAANPATYRVDLGSYYTGTPGSGHANPAAFQAAIPQVISWCRRFAA